MGQSRKGTPWPWINDLAKICLPTVMHTEGLRMPASASFLSSSFVCQLMVISTEV